MVNLDRKGGELGEDPVWVEGDISRSPHDHQRRGLTDRPRHRQDRAGQDARQRIRQHVVPNRLPFRRAQSQRSFPQRVGHRFDRFLSVDDDHRQDQQPHRQPG